MASVITEAERAKIFISEYTSWFRHWMSIWVWKVTRAALSSTHFQVLLMFLGCTSQEEEGILESTPTLKWMTPVDFPEENSSQEISNRSEIGRDPHGPETQMKGRGISGCNPPREASQKTCVPIHPSCPAKQASKQNHSHELYWLTRCNLKYKNPNLSLSHRIHHPWFVSWEVPIIILQ